MTPTTSGRHASDHSDNRDNRSARTQFDIEIGAGTNIDSLLVLWLKKKLPETGARFEFHSQSFD